MACALTTGYTFAGCDAGAGGIKQIGFCEMANASGSGSSIPTVTAGVITAWTLATGKVFRKYVPRKNTAYFTDSIVKDPKTGAFSYAPTVQISLYSLATTLRQEVQLLAQNALMIMVLDNQGIYRLLGYNNAMDMTTGDVNSGTALADPQSQVLTFVGNETIPAYEVTSSLIATLMP